MSNNFHKQAKPRHKTVWYGAGKCTFWTENFERLALTSNEIPCCPICHMVGFEMPADKWHQGAKTHDVTNPGYYDKLLAGLEICNGREMPGKLIEKFFANRIKNSKLEDAIAENLGRNTNE